MTNHNHQFKDIISNLALKEARRRQPTVTYDMQVQCVEKKHQRMEQAKRIRAHLPSMQPDARARALKTLAALEAD